MKTLMDHNMDNALDLLKIELPDKNVMRFVSDRADTVYQCEVHTVFLIAWIARGISREIAARQSDSGEKQACVT